jgi:hypothetical protein
MKTKQILIYIAALLLISVTSCREIEVKTIVNEDGSFTRIITVTGDSSDVFKQDLPYPVDETWEKAQRKDTSDAGDYILTYTKTYENSKILNEELASDTSWRKNLDRRIDVKRGFGFFYSYLTYREVYKAANPFNLIDYREYLTEEDLIWLSGNKVALNSEDSVRIEQAEERVEKFLQEAITLEIIQVVEEGIEQLDNSSIDPKQVVLYHDSIVSMVDKWDFGSVSDFIEYYANWTGNDEVLKLYELDPPIFKEIDEDMAALEKVFEMESYRIHVEVPGLITETNSLTLKGNQVSWAVTVQSFLLRDYEMVVKSRVVNVWAFWVAGSVLLLLVIVLILKARK